MFGILYSIASKQSEFLLRWD